jgi:uncharacterized membrane protein (DUF485 family)
MEKFSEFVEKLFLWLLKIVYYLMKVSLGLVLGTIIGLILRISIDNRVGEILFISFVVMGLILGIIYAVKARKSLDYQHFNQNDLEP